MSGSSSWRLHRGQFLFDEQTGHFFAVSAEGASIVRDLAQGFQPEEIERRLVSAYGIDRGTAMRDVEHFQGRLRKLGLLHSDTDD